MSRQSQHFVPTNVTTLPALAQAHRESPTQFKGKIGDQRRNNNSEGRQSPLDYRSLSNLVRRDTVKQVALDFTIGEN